MECNVQEIIKILNKIAPDSLAEQWDNVGLIVGKNSWQVNRILVALDLSFEVLEEAKEKDIDLIITHHPILFQKTQKINQQCIDSVKVISLITERIALYSLHTNFDACELGTSVAMGELLELNSFKKVENETANKYIRIGELKAPLNFEELVALLKLKFDIDSVRTIGYTSTASKVAVCPGSCYDVIKCLEPKDADVFITGELKYHEAIELYEKGFTVIEIGHFESEHIAMRNLSSYLQKRCNELKYNLCIYLSEKDASPIVFR